MNAKIDEGTFGGRELMPLKFVVMASLLLSNPIIFSH